MVAAGFMAFSPPLSLLRVRITVLQYLTFPHPLSFNRLSSPCCETCHRHLLRFPAPSRSSGLCSLAQAIKGNGNTVEPVKHVLDMANRALSRREALHTNFLTPIVLQESLLALENLAGVKAVALGGYPEAERCRLSVGSPEALESSPDVITGLCITGNFVFQPCSHGDFLGAILGTGIAREKLGDILLQGEKGAQILVVPELSDFLLSSLDKVGNVPVTCRKIPLSALDYEPQRSKSFRTVEASLRLDALASAGFKISRSKIVDLISKNVRINWTTVTKSAMTLKTGDTVSVDGKGRLKVGEINSTKKGKFAVELIRF